MKNYVIIKCKFENSKENMEKYLTEKVDFFKFLDKIENFKLKAVELINEKNTDRVDSNNRYLITDLLENCLNNILSLNKRICKDEYEQFEKIISKIEKYQFKKYFDIKSNIKNSEFTAFWIISFEDPNIFTKLNINVDYQYFDYEFFDPKEIKQNRLLQDKEENFQQQLNLQKLSIDEMKNTTKLTMYGIILASFFSFLNFGVEILKFIAGVK